MGIALLFKDSSLQLGHAHHGRFKCKCAKDNAHRLAESRHVHQIQRIAGNSPHGIGKIVFQRIQRQRNAGISYQGQPQCEHDFCAEPLQQLLQKRYQIIHKIPLTLTSAKHDKSGSDSSSGHHDCPD